MPPRREGFEPNLEAIMREVQRLQEQLIEYGVRPRGNPPLAHPVDQEGEEHTFSPSVDSEEEQEHPRFGRAYQRRERRNPDPPHRDYGVKVDMPAFDGGPEPDDFIDWLQEVERILEYNTRQCFSIGEYLDSAPINLLLI